MDLTGHKDRVQKVTGWALPLIRFFGGIGMRVCLTVVIKGPDIGIAVQEMNEDG